MFSFNRSKLLLCKVYLFTASNNNSTYLGIIVHLIESCDQLVHKTSTQRVESLGTVQCDQSNTTIGTWGGKYDNMEEVVEVGKVGMKAPVVSTLMY